MDITFEYATRDDCLEQMVPSDLRKLVVERDQAEEQVIKLREEVVQLRAENERLRESVEIMGECIGSAVNSFEGIRAESQFCDSCQAFERATYWLNEWHGGERVLPPNA